MARVSGVPIGRRNTRGAGGGGAVAIANAQLPARALRANGKRSGPDQPAAGRPSGLKAPRRRTTSLTSAVPVPASLARGYPRGAYT
jgi:hypothetical protein